MCYCGLIRKVEYFCKNTHFDKPGSTLLKAVDVVGHETRHTVMAAGQGEELKKSLGIPFSLTV